MARRLEYMVNLNNQLPALRTQQKRRTHASSIPHFRFINYDGISDSLMHAKADGTTGNFAIVCAAPHRSFEAVFDISVCMVTI